MLNRRNLFLAMAGVAATAVPAAADPNKRSVTYTVPDGIERIRVRSWKDGDEVLDTHFTVIPGQVFRIDAA